jgi:peptidyl-prolyl cis-trans isomerase A (cyclophilin A)
MLNYFTLMHKLIIILTAIIFISCKHAKYANPHIIINSFYGEVEVELYPEKAPKTVAAFLSYIDSGYYKNSSFYRVLSNENVPADANSGLIQGGIYKTNPNKLSLIPGIIHESTGQTGLSHTSGTISLARTTPGSATTEFFICIGEQLQFDSSASAGGDGLGFAAFGKVVNGMDVVRKIQNTPSHGEDFDTEIKISNIEKL